MMVIQSYDVKATSQRTFLSVESTTMLATRQIRLPQNVPQNAQQPANPPQPEDLLTLAGRRGENLRRADEDGQFRRLHRESRNDSLNELSKKLQMHEAPHRIHSRRRTQNSKMPTNPQELRTHLLRLMLDLLMGRSSRNVTDDSAESNSGKQGAQGFDLSSFFGGAAAYFSNRPQIVDGWRVEHFQFESEQVSYQAQGVVKTADGRTINVDINMFMSRQFVSYLGINVEASRPIDPLVINYGGTASSLMGDRFQFDLDMDGSLDNLAVLGEGSGFLAIDRNGDGKINNGSELFGPSTGCGFSELRKYDKDGNGWIDAGDEIFDKLVVWHRDKDGNDTTFTLKELGIGAIYLGDIETEFSFKGDNNETLGIMRSTSFFLTQNGGAGTLSHIDMMI